MTHRAPLITLHSGAAETVPNSMEYLQEAVSLKPDITEIDVRKTRDNLAVLCHDPYIRSGNGEYLLEEHSLRDLRELNPGLLTLREALAFSLENGLFLNLDLKTIAAADALLHELKRLPGTLNFIVTGCHGREAGYIRTKAPDIRVLLNVEEDSLSGSYGEAVADVVNQAFSLGCWGLNINYRVCRPELVRYALSRELPVMVWTIDTAEEMRRFWDMGVYSITTNNMKVLEEMLNKRQLK